MAEDKFTWIPYYKELAGKLLEYKAKRMELVDFVYTLDKTEYLHMQDGSKVIDIDPFSFYGIFNRQTTDENRKKNLQSIKNFFKLEVDVPTDFHGIPVLNNQRSFYFNWVSEEIKKSCDFLWDIFEKCIAKDISQSDIENLVNRKGIGFAMATMPLFWINSEVYLPMDKNTIEFLKKSNLITEEITSKNYLTILDEIRIKIENEDIKEKSIVEISYNAWLNGSVEKTVYTQGVPEMSKNQEIVELLKSKKNIILQGAPGTGKTYTTAEIALSLCGEEIDCTNHAAVMKKYQEYVDGGRIAFVTFHQTMDYEDFVEGIKPKTDGTGAVTYEIEDGIFKVIAKKALENGDAESDNFEECWEKLIEILNEKGSLSVPLLSGKTTFDIELNEYGDGLASRTYESDNTDWTRGKSKFFNKKQLENIYKGLPGIPSRGHDNYRKAVIEFMEKNIGLKKYAPSKTSSEENPYILIIDEINRGNVSKIFGELITLLEADKRTDGNHPLSVILPYSKEKFEVPSNLYIIGTMNTTDRSVGSIDYAVRRRFSFVTLEADRNVVLAHTGNDEANTAVSLFDAVKSFLKKNRIDMNIDDLMVGHSYFLATNDSELHMKWEYDILPLLREYYKDGIIKADVPKNAQIDEFIKQNPSESQKADDGQTN